MHGATLKIIIPFF